MRTELALTWETWEYDGKEYALAWFLGLRLYVHHQGWSVESWSNLRRDVKAQGTHNSTREGQLSCEAALRKYLMDSLTPKGPPA